MASRKRKENETFKQYRFNLLNEAFADKLRAKGTVFWNSQVKGTYRKGMA